MRQSKLFTKTRREAPKDETSKNAQLLIRAGFIHKEMPGVYGYLPLGFRVLEKINTIIREEMNAIGGQEIILTALQDKAKWEATGRWSDDVVDNWFKTKLKSDTELGLAFTHEEPIAEAVKAFVTSYKDLPFSLYQIQTKFRNETRAKAGLMRGREFLMKDLYSCSHDEAEHNVFYEKMKGVYMNVFTRLGIGEQTYITASNGQPFSKYSYEFQTVSEAGEDIIVIDEAKKMAINKQDFNETIIADLGLDGFTVTKEAKSIEVGDIYSLGYKYSTALGLTYKDEAGVEQPVYMGSYGMSPTRLMGTIVEVTADEAGLVWPVSVAPFRVHLIMLNSDDETVRTQAEAMYTEMTARGIEVLFDDRDKPAGEKFADSDLLGIPTRVIISKKTVLAGEHEVKDRKTGTVTQVSLSAIVSGAFLQD
jgi:prolyl-tRNA synthetase